jgi:N-acetylneuraminate synthase
VRDFEIGQRLVGRGRRFVIAEVAQAHDGSLGAAHAYVDAVAKAGADAVKFQTHVAEAESTPHEPFRTRVGGQDATRLDYWRRVSFSPSGWESLAAHAREAGLVFLSTPFSFEAADLLEALDVPAWKVGSGEVTNLPLVERLARTRRPVLLSSGLSTLEELDRAAETVREAGAPLGVFQCTSTYPCPPEAVGLNLLAELKERYDCPVGLSDHSGGVYAGLGAVALGADLLEVHVVFSRECFGPDVSSSVTTMELADLVRGVRFLETALASPMDKNVLDPERLRLKTIFEKSVVAVRDLAAGHRLSADDLALKKPGTGLPAARFDEAVGRRLARAVRADTPLDEADLEPSGGE